MDFNFGIKNCFLRFEIFKLLSKYIIFSMQTGCKFLQLQNETFRMMKWNIFISNPLTHKNIHKDVDVSLSSFKCFKMKEKHSRWTIVRPLLETAFMIIELNYCNKKKKNIVGIYIGIYTKIIIMYIHKHK